jgi:hypothetical protein
VIVVPPPVVSSADVASHETVIGNSGTSACAPSDPPPAMPVSPPVTCSAYQRIVPSSSEVIAPTPFSATGYVAPGASGSSVPVADPSTLDMTR